MTDKPFDFEKSLKELESIVETMEKGGLTLEQSLQSFEQGVKLTRLCQEKIKAAEQKVEILTKQGELNAFESEKE